MNHVTINVAVLKLEAEGLLASKGPRRCRRIVKIPGREKVKRQRIRLMPFDAESRVEPDYLSILDEPKHFIAVQNDLTSKGVTVPDEVSLICNDADPSFTWCVPSVTHLKWDLKKVVNHVVRWSERVALGENDRRQKLYDAELVEGMP